MVNINKKLILSAAIASATLTACSDEKPKEFVIPEPTKSEIAEAQAKELLVSINKEEQQLKALVLELQKLDPAIKGARYAYVDGKKSIIIARKEGEEIVEYTMPVDDDAENKTSSQLAQQVTGGQTNYSNHSSSSNMFLFMSFPSRHYYDDADYSRSVRKERKMYTERVAEKTKAKVTSSSIKQNYKADQLRAAKSYAPASQTFTSTGTGSKSSSSSSTYKSQPTLSTKRSVFSSSKSISSSRSSGYSFGG